MRILFKVLILIIVASAFLYLGAVYAQAPASTSTSEFSSVKAEIEVLLEENRKLEIKHKWLKEEQVHLKEMIKKTKVAVREMEKLQGKDGSFFDSKENVVKGVKEDVKKKQSELLINESKSNYLLGESIDSQNSLQLWHLKLKDLEYQKRSLEMELEYRKYLLDDDAQDEKKSFVKMDQKIMSNVAERKKILKEIEILNKEKDSFPSVVSSMRDETAALESKIKEMQKLMEFKRRENDILRNKLLYSDKSVETVFSHRTEEQKLLNEIVVDLEIEYKNLREGVSMSLEDQKLKRQYMKEVVKIDKENQKLRQKIEFLEKQIEGSDK